VFEIFNVPLACVAAWLPFLTPWFDIHRFRSHSFVQFVDHLSPYPLLIIPRGNSPPFHSSTGQGSTGQYTPAEDSTGHYKAAQDSTGKL